MSTTLQIYTTLCPTATKLSVASCTKCFYLISTAMANADRTRKKAHYVITSAERVQADSRATYVQKKNPFSFVFETRNHL